MNMLEDREKEKLEAKMQLQLDPARHRDLLLSPHLPSLSVLGVKKKDLLG